MSLGSNEESSTSVTTTDISLLIGKEFSLEGAAGRVISITQLNISED